MGESHVIIVGGGVIGMSLAWRLTGAGARVSVIDAGAGAPPATNAAAGMLAPSFEQSAGPLAEALYAFSVESLARWRDFAPMLERDAGMRIDYRDDGILGGEGAVDGGDYEVLCDAGMKVAACHLACHRRPVEVGAPHEERTGRLDIGLPAGHLGDRSAGLWVAHPYHRGALQVRGRGSRQSGRDDVCHHLIGDGFVRELANRPVRLQQ